MTPEQVALEVYGDQQYFWVVLLFNDLMDPQYRFPLRTRSLDDFISKKYPSKTLYLSPEGVTQEFTNTQTHQTQVSKTLPREIPSHYTSAKDLVTKIQDRIKF